MKEKIVTIHNVAGEVIGSEKMFQSEVQNFIRDTRTLGYSAFTSHNNGTNYGPVQLGIITVQNAPSVK